MTYYCFVLPLRKDSDGSWWQTDCDDIKFHNATTWPTLSPTPNPPPPPTDHPNQLTASLLPTGDRSPQPMVNEIMFRTCILLKVYTIHVLLWTHAVKQRRRVSLQYAPSCRPAYCGEGRVGSQRTFWQEQEISCSCQGLGEGDKVAISFSVKPNKGPTIMVSTIVTQ